MSKWARKTDRVQSALVRIAEAHGAYVADTSRVGQGFPDVVLGYRGRTLLVEFKDPSVEGRAHEFTPAQKLFRERWRGGEIVTIHNEAEMIALLESVRWAGSAKQKVMG